MIKVAPVSADLLIKLTLGVAVLGVMYFGYNKVLHAASGLLDVPGRVYDTVSENVVKAAEVVADLPRKIVMGDAQSAGEAGQQWQDQYAKQPASAQGYGGTYQGPLISDDGMNYGAF